jgi:hypothetical protein
MDGIGAALTASVSTLVDIEIENRLYASLAGAINRSCPLFWNIHLPVLASKQCAAALGKQQYCSFVPSRVDSDGMQYCMWHQATLIDMFRRLQQN